MAYRYSDSEKTYRLGELVRRMYNCPGNGRGEDDIAGRYVVLSEVRNGAGFDASRSADLIAISLWPSDGLRIIHHELKVSRADLKHELSDPSKAEETGKHCDEWWLTLWDEKIMDGLTIPETWGIMVRKGDEDADGHLHGIRRAPKRKTETSISRSYVASLLRNAARASAGAWQISEAVQRASLSSLAVGRKDGIAEIRKRLDDILYPVIQIYLAKNGLKSWDQPESEDVVRFLVEQFKK